MEKGQPLQRIVLVQLALSMQKNENRMKIEKNSHAQSLSTKNTLTNSGLYPVLHVLSAHCKK